jgi:hypothetical protein
VGAEVPVMARNRKEMIGLGHAPAGVCRCGLPARRRCRACKALVCGDQHTDNITGCGFRHRQAQREGAPCPAE